MFQAATAPAQTTRLSLPAAAVRIRKNGIEFRHSGAIPVWTEMTVDLQTPLDTRKVHCTGVIVACEGNRHTGYNVSMVFTSLSPQSQARLNSLVNSRLA